MITKKQAILKLKLQFEDILKEKNNFSRNDAEHYLKSECDVCDQIDSDSELYNFIRNEQDIFLSEHF